jgi:Flp pilus assembly protein TadD
LYYNEIAISYALLGEAKLADQAIKKAVSLEPNNINIARSEFGVYIRLTEKDPTYVQQAKNAIDKAIAMAPNDPKLYYNLGLMYARAGKNDEAKKILEKAIELKSNYQEPKNAIKILTEEK